MLMGHKKITPGSRSPGSKLVDPQLAGFYTQVTLGCRGMAIGKNRAYYSF
jgi:hypothetical protein